LRERRRGLAKKKRKIFKKYVIFIHGVFFERKSFHVSLFKNVLEKINPLCFFLWQQKKKKILKI